jgi:hypothetical protein
MSNEIIKVNITRKEFASIKQQVGVKQREYFDKLSMTTILNLEKNGRIVASASIVKYQDYGGNWIKVEAIMYGDDDD